MTITTSNPEDHEPNEVEIPADIKTVDDIVRFMIESLVTQNRLPPQHSEEICRLVLHRESLGSTAVGRGAAIPCAQTDLVGAPVMLIGRCMKPVNWHGSTDGRPVSLVCLTVSTSSPGDQVDALRLITRKLQTIGHE